MSRTFWIFGADPTNAVDSTEAFNAAANQINSSGRYKAVYAPTGSYRIDGQILIRNGQTFYGDGRASTVLIIDGAFSHTDSSVIFIQTVGTDNLEPGPTIRDMHLLFVQPQTSMGTSSQRANYKTLAAGGTVTTGIQYPWAISMAVNAGRTHLFNLTISGAWNGITTNGTSGIYWIDTVELGALNIGISIAEGQQSLDFAKWTNIEFWNFGLEVYTYVDGHTQAARIGGQNGLVASGISSFTASFLFTSEAGNCWADFTNLALDGDGATIEVDDIQWLHISNLYLTNSSSLINVGRPSVNVLGGFAVNITNWWSTSNSAYAHLNVAGTVDTQVSVVGGEALCFNRGVSAFQVSNGTLRLGYMKLKGLIQERLLRLWFNRHLAQEFSRWITWILTATGGPQVLACNLTPIMKVMFSV